MRDDTLIVVGPGGTWLLEKPLTLLKAALWIGIRVQKDVLMIECTDQLNVPREEHTVAEHITGHVANPYNGDIGCLNIDAQFSKMSLDRFPGPSRGNSHLLMIVAKRASRSECIPEPETVFVGEGIGDVGECGCSFIGCNDQVGIVIIVAHYIWWWDDVACHQVVGQVKHSLN